MQTHRYTWHVEAIRPGVLPDEMQMLGVSGDELEITRDGALVFWSNRGGGNPTRYVLLALAPGQWRAATIQSALTGHQNGYEPLTTDEDDNPLDDEV